MHELMRIFPEVPVPPGFYVALRHVIPTAGVQLLGEGGSYGVEVANLWCTNTNKQATDLVIAWAGTRWQPTGDGHHKLNTLIEDDILWGNETGVTAN